MIDHILVNVRDLARSKALYAAALAPLGYKVVSEYGGGVGFGSGARADVWLWRREPVATGIHIAILCGTRSMVDAFYDAAIKAGARDNGAPGPRAQYHPDYYGAFVLDPDGNNLEAVCHEHPLKR